MWKWIGFLRHCDSVSFGLVLGAKYNAAEAVHMFKKQVMMMLVNGTVGWGWV